jgi:hypothetical protein
MMTRQPRPSWTGKGLFSVMLVLHTTLGYSGQALTLNAHQRLEATIAQHELNRIAVEGDRISQVFGADGQFALESDDESGQIFIKSLNLNSRQPVNITLITEGGLTQDLKLIPRAIEATSLTLKSTALGQALPDNGPGTGSLLAAMRRVVQGQNPDRYALVACSTAPRATSLPITIMPQRCWQSVDSEILCYHLRYDQSGVLDLNEALLAEERDQALLLGTLQLYGPAATTLIVIRQRGEF